jgi:hypothetical protein
MKFLAALAFLLTFLVSCAAGPVYIAKSYQEGIRNSYQDPKLTELSAKNQDTLRGIYDRYQLAGIDIYPQGIGFTGLRNDSGRVLYFLLVDVRPRNVSFGMGQTTPQDRFSEVYTRQLEPNLRFVKPEDLQKTGVDGLAFAIHWPVRDYSQCDTYGGFLEYVMTYMSKEDFRNYTEGTEALSEALDRGEVVASLNNKPPEAIKVIRQE